MKDYATNSTEAVLENKTSVKSFFKNFVVTPLFSGFIGFTVFLAILITTKAVIYLIGIKDVFTISVNDLILSSIGFVLLFIIRVISKLKKS